MSYRAPVRDIRFSLDNIADLNSVAASEKFAEFSEDLTQAILGEAARLNNDVIAPLNRSGDLQGCTLDNGVVRTPDGFKQAYQAFVEGGWQGLQFPMNVGGMGLPKALGCALMEMLQGANMAFGLGPMLSFGAIEALIENGTDEQRALYLPKLISGEWSATMNLTESAAGSDVGALRTKATPNADGSWSITGQKIYITWGEHDCTENIIHLVLARTPNGADGTKGISLFLVPKFLPDEVGNPGERNSVKAIGLEHKLGIHGSPTCTMEFAEAKGWLIGEEFSGMAGMFVMMNSARLNVGVQGVGVAEAAYQRALAYAKDRQQGRALAGEGPGPHAIYDHPDVRRTLAVMKARIEAARAICFHAAVQADLGECLEDQDARVRAKRREDLMIPLAKAWSTDMAVEVTSMGIQLHGGMGFIEETGAAQYFRDARITPIYEGTNGIQAIDLVGRKLSRDGGQAMGELIADMRLSIENLNASSQQDLNIQGQLLATACDALEEGSNWLLGASQADRLMAATPYLKLAGDVTGGWLLCKGALESQSALSDEPAYARTRVSIARVFAVSVLSAAPGLIGNIQMGAASIFEPDTDWLNSA